LSSFFNSRMTISPTFSEATSRSPSASSFSSIRAIAASTLELTGRLRSASQQTGGQFVAVEIDPRAILLDDLRQAQLRPLVSRKPLVTLQTTPPPPDDVAIVVDAGVGDGCFVSAAERAFHPDDEP
jgi:hypothetical protein